MGKTIVIAGYGPGSSAPRSQRGSGNEGFAVALVARNADRLSAGVKALQEKGVRAAAFTTSLGDPAATRAVIEQVRASLGPITVLQWTAYDAGAGDLPTSPPT